MNPMQIFIVYRQFLEHDLINYAKENPGVVVYVKPRRHKAPQITAEYCMLDTVSKEIEFLL